MPKRRPPAWRWILDAVWLLTALAGPLTGFAAPPANDRFDGAVALPSDGGSGWGDNTDATLEPGEPNHAFAGMTAGKSVWFSWTAPADGFVQFEIRNTSLMQAAIALYRGEAINSLTLVFHGNDLSSSGIRVVQGGEYHLAVASRTGVLAADGGSFELVVRLALPPANDNFAERVHLEGERADLEGSTLGATDEDGEPDHLGFFPRVNSQSVWYEWIAPFEGDVILRATGFESPSAHPGTYVYVGESLNTLKRVSNGDLNYGVRFHAQSGMRYLFAVVGDGRFGLPKFSAQLSLSKVRYSNPLEGGRVRAGESFQIQFTDLPAQPLTALSLIRYPEFVGHYDGAFSNSMTLPPLPPGQHELRGRLWAADGREYAVPSIRVSATPAGDDRSQPLAVSGNNVRTNLNFAGSTYEADEVPAAEGSGSLWLRWTAPITGPLALSTVLRPTLFELFEILTDGAHLRVESLPTVEGGACRYPVVAGRQYGIRAVQSGPVPLVDDIIFGVLPNDDFAARIQVAAVDNQKRALSYDPAGGSTEPGEPTPRNGPSQHTAWWSWTAPDDGKIRYGATPAFDAVWLSVFRGDALATLESFGAPSVGGQVVVRRGQTLAFRLEAPAWLEEASGWFQFFGKPTNDLPAQARVLQGAGETIHDSLELATVDPADTGGLRSVWYRFTAPRSGAFQVRLTGETAGPNYVDSGVDLYRGVTAPAALITPALNGDHAQLVLLNVGETVWIKAVTRALGDADEYAMTWEFVDRPGNDSFSGRIRLVEPHFEHTNDTRAATIEAGEPIHHSVTVPLASNGSRKTVWYEWRPPASGHATVFLRGIADEFYPVGAIYSGTSLGGLSPVIRTAFSSDGTNTTSLAQFPTVAGTAYQIAIDGQRGVLSGRFEMALDVTTLRLTSPLPDARLDAGEAIVLAINSPLPTADGTVQSVRYVAGKVSVPTIVRELANAGTAPFAATAPPGRLTPGRYALFAVATNTAGKERLSPAVMVNVGPANDRFQRATHLPGFGTISNCWLVNSTVEAGEKVPGGTAGSVWFEWVSPETGQASVWFDGADTPLTVHTGETLAELKPVSLFQEGSLTRFAVVNGTRYRISLHRSVGSFTEAVTFSLQPHFSRHTILPHTLQISPAGNLEFEIGGPALSRLSVSRSDDLKTWTPLVANEPFSGRRLVSLSAHEGIRAQFFRVDPAQ